MGTATAAQTKPASHAKNGNGQKELSPEQLKELEELIKQKLEEKNGDIEFMDPLLKEGEPSHHSIHSAENSCRDEVLPQTMGLVVTNRSQLAEALERINKGIYGICFVCGKPIEARRLFAMPETTTHYKCSGN